MNIFREIPPTAGFPVYLKELMPFFQHGSLEDDFKGYLGVESVNITYSGTAALYLILESLKNKSDKSTVIIPSYICPLVPLAINRAGLKVEVCDISENSFDFNTRGLEEICSRNKDILAVIVVHLAGIPIDFDAVKNITGDRGIFIIEDCAQSLGAQYKGRKVGTLGDVSFFSLCRGKGLTIYEGGAAVVNNKECARAVDKAVRELVRNDFLSESLKILELFGYWIFYRPLLFWFVFNLPQIFWNLKSNKIKAMAEYYTVDFPTHKVSKYRKNTGHAAFHRLEPEISKQREKAQWYFDVLKEIKGIKIIKEAQHTKAVYPYIILLFDEPSKRDRALELFHNKGLGISTAYLYAITDYDYLKPIIPPKSCPNAQSISRRHITLSTGTFLKKKDVEMITSIMV